MLLFQCEFNCFMKEMWYVNKEISWWYIVFAQGQFITDSWLKLLEAEPITDKVFYKLFKFVVKYSLNPVMYL